jgi:hypothetical protein
MLTSEPKIVGSGPTTEGEENVFLVGRPPFEEYLAYMSTEPVGSENAEFKQLADEWRAANDHIKALQKSEEKWADNPPIKPIPEELASLAADVLSDPIFQKTYATVPVDLGLVELDRLVVFQKSINLAYVNQLKGQLGQHPSPEDVFQLCMPSDHPVVPYRVRRTAPGQFSFVSVSSDLRVLELTLLNPNQIINHKSNGIVAGVIALFVGYGANYLSVASAEGRLVLINASHRAYALRDLGVTHAPCVIQKVTRREELNVVAAGLPLSQNPDQFLKEARPPVLKDYFDPKLRKIVRLLPKARQVRVGAVAEQTDIPWE